MFESSAAHLCDHTDAAEEREEHDAEADQQRVELLATLLLGARLVILCLLLRVLLLVLAASLLLLLALLRHVADLVLYARHHALDEAEL